MRTRSLSCLLALLVVGLTFPASSHAQRVAKYGADFLAGGVGARALGMGGAAVALTQDVTAGYWNAAGLTGLQFPEVAYMHSERFAGAVSFDYGSAAFPINARSTIGISFFRSGVNDIKNTLDAWDPERDQPKANPEQFFRSFSAADLAFFLTYSRALSDRLAVGLTAKLIRRGIGDFATAMGYSLDLGIQYRAGQFLFGANIQDLTTMLQSWSVDPDAFGTTTLDPATGQPYTFAELTGDAIPEGGTELVLPVARLGTGYLLPLGPNTLALGFDVDLAFDGQQAFALNAGDISFHPRFGTEFSYKGVVALRAGINRIQHSEQHGWDFTPSVGTGLTLNQLSINYGFGDFAGWVSDLGYTHRISLRLVLEQPRFERGN